MDNLQYIKNKKVNKKMLKSFKPYYKWIIFNIMKTLGVFTGIGRF